MPETTMNRLSSIRSTIEVIMHRPSRPAAHPARRERGQIIVIAAMSMVALIGGVSLILEAGNAYAHQRVAQNAADSVANAGAVILAQRLGGGTEGDAEILAAIDRMADANKLDSYTGYYTDWQGHLLDNFGLITTDTATAAQVGNGDGSTIIPTNARGVDVGGSLSFDTTFARVLGINQFTASADAIAVAGPTTGGLFLPVVFPVSMADCDGTGSLVGTDEPWRMSSPDKAVPPVTTAPHLIGVEYIVPLCKTNTGPGSSAFMILDLDPTKNCQEETEDPTPINFGVFPAIVATDTGNDCAKKIEDGVAAANLQGTIVKIPVCDDVCHTGSGSGGDYHIIRIASFYLDYISYSNAGHNAACSLTSSPTYGTPLVNIVGGNGSSSCIAGWFVRYVTKGPVGGGPIVGGESLSIQLVK
jgi:hypothetical protein